MENGRWEKKDEGESALHLVEFIQRPICVPKFAIASNIFFYVFFVSCARFNIMTVVGIDIFIFFWWHIHSKYLKRAVKKDPLALVFVVESIRDAHDVFVLDVLFCVLERRRIHHCCKSSRQTRCTELACTLTFRHLCCPRILETTSDEWTTERNEEKWKTNNENRTRGWCGCPLYNVSDTRYGSLCSQMFSSFFSPVKSIHVVVVGALRCDTKLKWYYSTELNIIQFYYVRIFFLVPKRLLCFAIRANSCYTVDDASHVCSVFTSTT